jgi:hypothetical protein
MVRGKKLMILGLPRCRKLHGLLVDFLGRVQPIRSLRCSGNYHLTPGPVAAKQVANARAIASGRIGGLKQKLR